MIHTYLNFRVLVAFMMLSFVFSACDKDKLDDINPTTEEEQGTATTPDNPTPSISDADAVLIAVQSVSYVNQPVIGTIETTIGLGIAVFPDGSGGNLDAGAVSSEGESLTQNSNNSYTYSVSASTPTGLSFSGTVDWVVAGNSNVTGINKSVSGTFPSSLEMATATGSDVSTSADFTLSTNLPVSDADSIIFAVYGPTTSVFVTKEASINSHTFTQSEMSSLGTGAGFVQVTAYKVVATETAGSTKYYFINEKVNTTTVNFI